MYHYSAYGLTVASEFELPELDPLPEKKLTDTDICIRRPQASDSIPSAAAFPHHTQSERFIRPFIRLGPDEIGLLWENRGRGLVRAGRELIVAANKDATAASLRLHILGSGLSVLLHQKGYFPVHAGGVVVDGEAIGFMGLWGEGKSTLTAVLAGFGLPCLGDDLLAIDLNEANKRPLVSPGLPQLKLWTEAVRGLNLDPSRLKRLIPEVAKYGYRLSPTDMAANPAPLGAIYALSSDQTSGRFPRIEKMTEKESFLALLVNWYGTRFGNAFLTPGERIEFLERVTTLVQMVPFYRLVRTRSLADLENVGIALQDHFRANRSTRLAEIR